MQDERHDPLDYPLPLERTGRSLKVGYVGHWYSSVRYRDYLDETLAQILKLPKVPDSIFIENTACNAMDVPQVILEWLERMKTRYKGQLTVSGFQVRSIGLWQPFYWNTVNIPATVSTSLNGVQWPSCHKLENAPCLEYQLEESFSCTEGARIKRLKCETVPVYYYWINEMSQPQTDLAYTNRWIPINNVER